MRIQSSIRNVVVLMTCLVALPLLVTGQAGQSLPMSEIVSRMTKVQDEAHARGVAYSVTREYQLSDAGSSTPSSQVVAEINFVPPGAKDYSIVKSEGSDRGRSIVRKVLDHETEMAGRSEEHEVSARNYDFALLGREMLNGRECYVLQLTPRRQEVELIRGKAWVDAQDFGIRRMQGSPAKDPSMWIKNLTVTIDYGQVNGVWIATATKAIADLHFAGTHVLTSRELDLRTATASAHKQPPSTSQSRSYNAQRDAANAATWVAR